MLLFTIANFKAALQDFERHHSFCGHFKCLANLSQNGHGTAIHPIGTFLFLERAGVILANLYTAFPDALYSSSSFMAPGMIYVIYKTFKAVLYSTASVARCQLVTLAFYRPT